ncbi:hypothetical protein FACS1894176_03680 [Bacteroidia bacterium]|nr:hypothetical protein FACS189428_7630 [Clostridia bacterium]GHV25368.1 hypothetical protein FACS1894176_03680 [Bacteroidia bacterium]
MESTEERNDNATGEKGKTYQTTMDTSTLSVIINGTNKTLQSILLSIITLVFMRFIIKIAIASKTGIGILDKFTEKSTGAIRDFAGQIPIIPIGNGGAVGIDYIRDGRKDDGGDKSIINRAVNKNGIAEERKQKNDDAISKLFGQKNSNLYTEDYTRLAALSNQADNKFIQETMKHSTNGKNIGLIDDTRTNSFIVRLDKNNGKLKEYGFSDELFTGNDEE